MLELKGLFYQVEDNGVKTEILRGIDLTIEELTEKLFVGFSSFFCNISSQNPLFFAAIESNSLS